MDTIEKGAFGNFERASLEDIVAQRCQFETKMN